MEHALQGDTPSGIPAHRLLVAGFCLGGYSVLSQVVLVRETLVAVLGSELILGLLFGAWLMWVGAGAGAYRILWRWNPRLCRSGIPAFVAAWLAAAGLPAACVCLPAIRGWLGLAAGEQVPVSRFVLPMACAVAAGPLAIGFAFPALAAARDTGPGADGNRFVSRLYLWESLGACAGGLATTFFLLDRLPPLLIAVLASGVVVLGAAGLVRNAWIRLPVLCVACVLGWGALGQPSWARRPVEAFNRMRLRQQGLLPASRDPGASRIVATADSRYQNLVVTGTFGQYSMYGDGQVMFSFPDPAQYEMTVNIALAQKPEARRILVLGGNLVGEVPEFLRHPVERVVWVEIDPAVDRLLAVALPERCQALTRDPRLEIVHEDPWRFVQRTAERFDFIYLAASPPLTLAASRLWTVEFYRSVRCRLAPGGVFWTSLRTSERLRSSAAGMAAAVYGALRAAFPAVMMTAADPAGFAAGEPDAGITGDPSVLHARAGSWGLDTMYFRPEYFLGAEELQPERIRLRERQLATAGVAANTVLKPTAFFHAILLQGQIGDSPVERAMAGALRVPRVVPAFMLVAVGVLALWAFGRRPAGPMAGAGIMGTTGFYAMGMEILLLFMMQSLYGYVHTRVGLVVAVFMVALAAGSAVGRRGVDRPALWLMRNEGLLVLAALAIPLWASWAAAPGRTGRGWEEWIPFLLMGLVGVVTGAEFPLALRLLNPGHDATVAAASRAETVDHVGAACGSLLVGAVVVPVFGTAGACAVLAGLKLWGLLLMARFSRQVDAAMPRSPV